MQARNLLQQHDARTNRIFMYVVWVSLLAVSAVLTAFGKKLRLDLPVFISWSVGSMILVAFLELMMWRRWAPSLVKYFASFTVIAAVTAITYLLEGTNQHLGIWFVPIAFSGIYLNARLSLVATMLSLAGWLSIISFNQPEVAGTMTLPRLALVNSVLIIIVGSAVAALCSQFRKVHETLSGAVAQEEVMHRLDIMVAQARASAQTLAATSFALNKSGQAASGHIRTSFAPLVKGLGEESGQSERLVGEALQAIEELTETVSSLARGAQMQSTHVTASSAAVDEMAASIQDVHGLAEQVEQDAGHATAAARQGTNTVRSSAAGMDALSRAIESAATQLDALGTLSKQIDAVVTTISEFAGQTNLLALNAAIEAARAGDAGRGFAVVAQEVRNLSERSGRATSEIATLIQQVQSSISQSVQAMQAATAQVGQSVQLSHSTGERLSQIQGAVDATSARAREIAGRAETLARSSSRLVDAMAQLAAITEENTASAEEMAAASEQVLQSTREIGAGARSRAQRVTEVATATDSISAIVAELAASAATLDQLAAGLQRSTA